MTKASDLIAKQRKILERNPYRQRLTIAARSSGLAAVLDELKKGLEHETVNEVLLPFFPITLVTCIEVFFRDIVRELVDHGSPYIDRAEPLLKELKFDLESLKALQGRTTTLGEVISLGPSFQSLETICNVMSVLTGTKFLHSVAKIEDRWLIEIDKEPREPIIGDINRLAATLSRLFEVRHIVVHEVPYKFPFDETQVRDFINATDEFLNASDWLVSNLINPNAPLDQAGMTEDAAQRAGAAHSKLLGIVAEIGGMLRPDQQSDFDKVQAAWEAFLTANAEFEAGYFKGGSIAPMIYSEALSRLTSVRSTELNERIEEMTTRD